MEGWWDCDDLVDLIRILARNEEVLRRWTAPTLGLLAPWHRCPSGARATPDRRAAQHRGPLRSGRGLLRRIPGSVPDLLLRLFRRRRTQDLAAAQTRQAGPGLPQAGSGARRPRPGDRHRLGQLRHPRRPHYGCRVTTTTLSAEQARYAADQVRRLGLADRITVLQKDYRELTGQYDKLVSLEMIEAVGVTLLPDLFPAAAPSCCEPDGAMLLQAIVGG